MLPRLPNPFFPLKKFTQSGFAPQAVITSHNTDAATKSSLIKYTNSVFLTSFANFLH